MLAPIIHRARRLALTAEIPGPILLLGNGLRSRNLPMNALPFRQDSTFLYYTGCAVPAAAAVLDGETCTLFLPEPSPDDDLWHGPVPTLAEIGERLGVDEVRPARTLPEHVSPAVRVLAVADEERNRLASALTGVDLAFGESHGDPELASQVIAQRRAKSADELAEMRAAAGATEAAHRAVMSATRPGTSERALAALFQGVLAARGCGLGYGTILTQRGEVLHNHDHSGVLEAGRLLLLDGGGEVATGYGADVTRTWPVSGRFTARQRAAYDAVLEAEEACIGLCRAGTPYLDVHLRAARVLARFLLDERLARGTVDEIVETGAHAVFFPHGVGHLLGLDVHDLENFGDLPAYPPGAGRREQFGLSYLRLDLPLEPGWVVTIEPGFYVVPAILHDARLRELHSACIDFDRAAGWEGFGGIRIEDDVVVTDQDPEVLTGAIPKRPEDLEAIVGDGPTVEERLG